MTIALGGGPTDALEWRTVAARIAVILAAGAVLIALFIIVVAPLSKLVLASISQPEIGGLTLRNYVTAFGQERHLRALVNSLLLGFGATALSLVIAVPMAWAVSRTNMPCKSLVRLTVIATFITPSYLGSVAWILLAAPNAGWLNRLWQAASGTQSNLFTIYSFEGLIFVVSIYAYPFVFVAASAAFDLISSEMEDAASILGAGRWRTMLKITVPLALPAIFAGGVLVFLDTIALFGVPALIAIPARINVMTTQLWSFFEYPVQVELAAAYCIPLIGITIVLLWVQRLLLARRGFVSVTGKGAERRPLQLGAWRWVALGYCLFSGLLSVYLPLLVICQAAFAKAWGRGISLTNLTLGNFHYLLFDFAITRESIVHTIVYSAIAATVSVVMAVVIAYIVTRRVVPFARGLGFLVMAPFVIPGIVLGMAYYATFAPMPFLLNGTATLVVLTFIGRYIPIGYINSTAALQSLNPEMEHAARILGAGPATTIRRILGPLLKGSLAGAWLLIFIPAARELSTALFVVGPRTRVLSILMLDLNEQGSFENLAAAGCILLVVMLATLAIGLRFMGRDFMLRR